MHLIIKRQHEEIRRQFAHWEKIKIYEQEIDINNKNDSNPLRKMSKKHDQLFHRRNS